jgi:phosphotransferase system HPr-like phosphotransfer protein
MKNKLVMSVLLGCSVWALNLNASAQGSNAVQNVQRYDARFTLTATPDAPAGAKGKATIKSVSTDGNQTATLSLQTQGLDVGDYTVTAVTPDGSVPLGQITIEDPSNGNGRGRGRLRSDSEVELTDIAANDILQLIVSTNGTDLLVGDLTAEGSKSKATLNATVPLIPGEAAPEASGLARLKSSINKGKIKNSFVLIATGVAPDTTYTVEVDGLEAGTATSNKKGKVMVKKLPSTITAINTVRLLDPEGIEAVRAEF